MQHVTCASVFRAQAIPGQIVILIWYSSDATITSLMIPPSFNIAVHVTQTAWEATRLCDLKHLNGP